MMTRVRWKAAAILGSVLLSAVFAACWWEVWVRQPGHPGPEIGQDLLASSSDFLPRIFETMRWPDVAPTVEGIVSSPSAVETVLSLSSGATNAAAVYFRALLLVSQERSMEALHLLDLLDPQIVPSDHLYLPYRLHNLLRQNTPNPYRSGLQRAARENRLQPLVGARFHAQEVSPRKALEAYLQSDPAQWTGYDMVVFRGMLQQAGLRTDSRRLLLGALRGGRVPARWVEELTSLLAPGLPEAPDAGKVRMRMAEVLRRDQNVRQAAVTAAGRQLELRQRFVGRDYQRLLEEYRTVDMVMLPNETVLLLTLAAARERSSSELDRWTQELKRRTPLAEVEQWIQEIRSAVQP